MLKKIFSKENLSAVILCVVVLLVIIVTAEDAPPFIYQGF